MSRTSETNAESTDLIQQIQADRQLLQSIFDRIPGMIYIHDLKNDVSLYRSWSLKKILGYSESPILNTGKGIRSLLHPDDLPEFSRASKEFMSVQDNECVSFEYRMRHADGEWLWFRSEEYVYERDTEGTPIKCLGYATDLTAQINQKKELDELNRVNQFLLKAAQILSQPQTEYKVALQQFAVEVSLFLQAVCDISMLDEETGIISPEALHHPDEEVRNIIQGLFSSVVVRAGSGLVGSVISSGKEVLIADVPEQMKIGPRSVDQKIVPESIMYVPLRGSRKVLGSLNLTRLEGQNPFDQRQADQIRRLGDYASLFVENSLLKQQQKAEAIRRISAESKLEEENRWAEFKLEVSSLLADVHTDLNGILQKFAKHVALHFDVVCDIQLLDMDNGDITLVALHHPDQAVESAIEKVITKRKLKIGEGMVGQVVQTGREFFMPMLSAELRTKVEAEKVNPLIVPSSFVYVPIKSHEHILGTLDLTRLSNQTQITQQELVQIRDLAAHAARFIENRLLQASQKKEIALRKRAEQKQEKTALILTRLEAETRAILNSIPIFIARVSKDLRYLFLNQTYQLMGIDPRKAEGRYIKDILGEQVVAKVRPNLEKVLSGETVAYEYEGVMHDGVFRTLSIVLTPDLSESGDIVGFFSCSIDITSRVLAEKEARLTQDRLETLTLNSGDAFFFHDVDQRILDVNQVAIDLLGYTREEFLSIRAEQVDPRWKGKSFLKFLQTLEPNIPQTFDTSVYHKDGTEIPVEVRFVKRQEAGNVYIQSLVRDRTEKREQEMLLQQSEERLRLIFENVEDYIAIIDENGVFESINKTSQGLEEKDVIGTSIFDFYDTAEKKEELRMQFEKLKATGSTVFLEDSYTGPDGSRRSYTRKFIGIFFGDRFYKAVLIIRDVTSERDREQSVMMAVLRGQEQERKRLGAELHDGIGQVLSAISLKVSQLRSELKHTDLETATAGLNTLGAELQEAIREVRNISHDLMPEVLESLGMKAAFAQMCSGLQDRSGIKVEFDSVDLESKYDPLIEVNLYRIAQELLTNAQKHSKSKNLFVSLIDHGDSLNLTVEDDGRGFDPNLDVNGIGLKNVRSRLKVISGQIDIESAVSSGTLINIEIPKTEK